ncbi:MAG TPA: pyridoxal phosphate-dependent aminotransferase [Desulfobacterales bacterium]|jgi:aspartate aminotransferase|nr:pyridoxal phosphate-dependent aminotransferase [Desulfobacterales bacterium]HSM88566.1 pyridoxal phosphate-dependent aminotransferase [Desulfobacterales bacterium]
MAKRWAKKIDSLSESMTVAVSDRARELQQRGVQVVNLGGGDPDFDTPPHIVAAAVAAIDKGLTHYVASRGIPELRKAVAGKFQRDNHVAYDPDTEVIVTASGKLALYITLAAMLEPGDEVLYFDPAWVSYEPMIRMLGGIPAAVPLRPADNFILDGDALKKRVSPRTKAMILNTPNNPTGRVLTAEELDVVARSAREHGYWVLSDEIYEHIIYDRRRHISLASLPGMRDLTVTLNGMSKAYAMTGWRLGYLGAPAPLCEQILKVQQHVVTCAPSFVQAAGVAALQGPQGCVDEMTAEYDRRRRFMADALNAIPGVHCPLPEGAFYLFPEVAFQGLDSNALAKFMIEKAHVAVTPGSAFGHAGTRNIRLTFATSMANLRQAAEQMKTAMA